MATPTPITTPSPDQAPDTPILRLYRCHQLLLDAANAAPRSLSDAEAEQIFNAPLDRLEAKLLAMPCTCAADLAAKVLVESCDGLMSPNRTSSPVLREARQLTRRNAA